MEEWAINIKDKTPAHLVDTFQTWGVRVLPSLLLIALLGMLSPLLSHLWA